MLAIIMQRPCGTFRMCHILKCGQWQTVSICCCTFRTEHKENSLCIQLFVGQQFQKMQQSVGFDPKVNATHGSEPLNKTITLCGAFMNSFTIDFVIFWLCVPFESVLPCTAVDILVLFVLLSSHSIRYILLSNAFENDDRPVNILH